MAILIDTDLAQIPSALSKPWPALESGGGGVSPKPPLALLVRASFISAIPLRAKIVSTPSAMPPPKCTALFIMVRIMGRAPQWRRDIIELAASIQHRAPIRHPVPSRRPGQ